MRYALASRRWWIISSSHTATVSCRNVPRLNSPLRCIGLWSKRAYAPASGPSFLISSISSTTPPRSTLQNSRRPSVLLRRLSTCGGARLSSRLTRLIGHRTSAPPPYHTSVWHSLHTRSWMMPQQRHHRPHLPGWSSSRTTRPQWALAKLLCSRLDSSLCTWGPCPAWGPTPPRPLTSDATRQPLRAFRYVGLLSPVWGSY
jgi:hypothetical protein